MEATISIKKPQTVSLTYEEGDSVAKKALDFLISLGIFRITVPVKSQIEMGLQEYKEGKYKIINKGIGKNK